MKHATKEDYLRAIFYIREKQEDKKTGIKSVEIARFLNISKPSVSDMVKKLSKEGFVNAGHYSNISFTKKGLNEAKRVTHNHRVIEVFLTNVLGHKAELLEPEVHHLEHAFSEESIRKIDNMLNNPKTCPHGNVIYH